MQAGNANAAPSLSACAADAWDWGELPAGWRLPTGQRLRNDSLSIWKVRIFHSSVWRGMPSLAAAPRGPETRPCDSVSAASISDLSLSASVVTDVARDGLVCFLPSHDSSIANVSPSLNTTAR